MASTITYKMSNEFILGISGGIYEKKRVIVKI